MAKRFYDTDKFKKRFYRGLPAPYKLFWDFLLCDCDCAGIWIVDIDIAQIYLGTDAKVNLKKALELFNKDKERIYEFLGGQRWLILPFAQFQYGELNEKCRTHAGAIARLTDYGLLEKVKSYKGVYKEFSKSYDTLMVKDKDKVKEKVKEENKEKDEVQIAAELYNEILPELPKVRIAELLRNTTRKQKIACRIKEIGGMDNVRTLYEEVRKSAFLMGVRSDFRANFGWLLEAKGNWVKVMEGNYTGSSNGGNSSLQNGQVLPVDEQSREILKKSGL